MLASADRNRPQRDREALVTVFFCSLRFCENVEPKTRVLLPSSKATISDLSKEVVVVAFWRISEPDFRFFCFLHLSRCPAKNRAGPKKRKKKKRDGGEQNLGSHDALYDAMRRC